MKWWINTMIGILMGLGSACTQAPPPDDRPIRAGVRHEGMRWSSAVIVTRDDGWRPSSDRGDGFLEIPDDAEAGSAAPVTADGYFLTANHVVSESPGVSAFLCYGHDTLWRRARVVWRDMEADLALLHVPIATPGHYRWSPAARWVPSGSSVFHVGITTGTESPKGSMLTSLKPESNWTGNRLFKIDLPLLPGDSGGAVLDADGRLVGVNSAVEYLMPMETPIFIDSEASRPNLSELERIIRLDRQRKHAR